MCCGCLFCSVFSANVNRTQPNNLPPRYPCGIGRLPHSTIICFISLCGLRWVLFVLFGCSGNTCTEQPNEQQNRQLPLIIHPSRFTPPDTWFGQAFTSHVSRFTPPRIWFGQAFTIHDSRLTIHPSRLKLPSLQKLCSLLLHVRHC